MRSNDVIRRTSVLATAGLIAAGAGSTVAARAAAPPSARDVAKALKLAKAADERSREALKAAGAGPAGPKGPIGAAGPAGPAGPSGLQGERGAQGVPGSPGAQGIQGETGQRGPTGTPGARGDTGMSGATGQRGATGSSGATVSSAAVFADRSGVSGALSLGSATGTSGTEVLVRTITVAQPSRLVGTGAATLAADGGSQFAASCGFYVTPSGGSEVRGGDDTTLLAPSSQVSTVAVVGGIAAPAGTHTVRLRCSDASSQQAVVTHATFAVVATADAG